MVDIIVLNIMEISEKNIYKYIIEMVYYLSDISSCGGINIFI